MAKTDWQIGDTVQPEDINQIGQEINDNTTAAQNAQTAINTHEARTDNPHNVTVTQIGAETPTGAQAKVDTHAALTNAHGATSAATASRIVMRDGSGRAKVAAPAASDDIARKAETDAALAAAQAALPKDGSEPMTGPLIVETSNSTPIQTKATSASSSPIWALYNSDGTRRGYIQFLSDGRIRISSDSGGEIYYRINGSDFKMHHAGNDRDLYNFRGVDAATGLTDIDATDIPTGYYRLQSGYLTNNPTIKNKLPAESNTTGTLYVQSSAGGIVVQHWVSAAREIWRRIYYSGWGSWGKIITDTNSGDYAKLSQANTFALNLTVAKQYAAVQLIDHNNNPMYLINMSDFIALRVGGSSTVNDALRAYTDRVVIRGVLESGGPLALYEETAYVRRTNKTGRLVLAGGATGSSSDNALIIIEGNDYGGAGQGGEIHMTPGSGKSVYISGNEVLHTGNAVIVGEYSGNGSTSSRTISLGFEAAMVYVQVSNQSNPSGYYSGITSHVSFGTVFSSSGPRFGDDLTLASTGFTVRNGALNSVNTGYRYVAIRRR